MKKERNKKQLVLAVSSGLRPDCFPESTMLNDLHSSLTFEWIDSKKAAQYLSISVQTLLNLTSTGQLPYYKFGRLNRYRKDELDSVLLKHKKGK